MQMNQPDYFERFECIAGKCPATCCAGWEIGIDPKSMKRYQQMEGPFGNRLNNSIDVKHGVFQQYDRKCCFLNDEQLCDIYTEAGEEYLCETCRTYPRHIEVYKGERDISLAISCPEAARIILTNTDKVQWKSCWEDAKAHSEDEEDDEFDSNLFKVLKRARKVTIDFLQMRELPIQTRMALALAMSHDLQRRAYWGETELMDDLLEKYPAPMVLHSLTGKIRSYRGRMIERRHIMRKLIRTDAKLEVLNPEWKKKIRLCKKNLHKYSSEEYLKLYQAYLDDRKNTGYDMMLEQMVCYFAMNYYCTAVYDNEIYAKMKFAIFSTLIIQEVCFAQWLKQGRTLSEENIICNSYQYGREVEHLEHNLNLLDRIFSKKNYYRLEELLIAVL